ncbi:hypothetical protein Tco_0493017 [Tanacetum coccineum]
MKEKLILQVEREDNRNSDGAKTNSTGSRKFKMSEIPRTGGSILSVMEEIVKVGITMGYNMDGRIQGHSWILMGGLITVCEKGFTIYVTSIVQKWWKNTTRQSFQLVSNDLPLNLLLTSRLRDGLKSGL